MQNFRYLQELPAFAVFETKRLNIRLNTSFECFIFSVHSSWFESRKTQRKKVGKQDTRATLHVVSFQVRGKTTETEKTMKPMGLVRLETVGVMNGSIKVNLTWDTNS